MKQKVVIRLSPSGNDQRCRTKAFKIAVSQPGVESAAMTGGEKSQLEVVGDQIDAVALTNQLRKKLGQAELLSVGPAGGGYKKDKKPGQYPVYRIEDQCPVFRIEDQYPVYQVTDCADPQS